MVAVIIFERGLLAVLDLALDDEPLAKAFLPFTKDGIFLRDWPDMLGLVPFPWAKPESLNLSFSIALHDGSEFKTPTDTLGFKAHFSDPILGYTPPFGLASLRGKLWIAVGPLVSVLPHSRFL